MPSFGDLFGKGSIAEQMFVYGVLQQVVGAVIGPGLVELQKLVNSEFPLNPLGAADAAQAVARQLMPAADGTDAAGQSGFGPDVFASMVKLAQHAPDISAVIVAYRRGLIKQGAEDGADISLHGALADAGIPAKWHSIIEGAAIQEPTVAEVMNAWLEGQIDETEALRRYKRAGGDPSWFHTSFNANGEAPTPVQALELLNRGIIPERGTGPAAVSFEQAFLEGPWRNKWLEPFLALGEYLPPPRTVTAMHHSGAISDQLATSLLIKQGLTPALAAAYLVDTTATKTAAAKTLTEANIISLYEDQLLSVGEAIAHLTAIKYTAADAALLVKLADLRVSQKQYSAAVTRIRSLYLAGDLTDAQARDTLGQVGVNANQIPTIIAAWRLEVAHQKAQLSAAQLETAFYYGLITAQEASDALQARGYSPLDAWTLLSIRTHGPITDIPRPGGLVH